jgi:2-polyprenyl-3-methyl-5-hydroxy-6-metoxy-1,4-benzoquinol methylase
LSDFGKDYFKTYAEPRVVRMKTSFFRGLMDYLKVPNGKGRALDIGCGYGYSSSICNTEYGYEVYGTDISLHALGYAKKNSCMKGAVLCDVQNGFPFVGVFDLVMCFEVLEHLENAEKAIKNIYEALNPSGLFVASTPNPLTKSHWDSAHADPTHIGLKSAKEWKSVLEVWGFSKIKVYNVHFIPMLWRLTGKLSVLRLGSTFGNYILFSAIKPEF